MRHYGKRTVRMIFPGVRGEGTATFEATDLRRPIFSAGRLADTGHVAVLRAGDPHILRPTGEKMPLEMHNGLPYLRASAVSTIMTSRPSSDTWRDSWIAPVDEPMPPALSRWSRRWPLRGRRLWSEMTCSLASFRLEASKSPRSRRRQKWPSTS